MHHARVEGYQSIRGVGRAAMGLLLANGALVLLTIPSALLQIGLLSRIERGDFTEDELAANDAREAVLGLGISGLYLLTAVVFLVFLHRAYRNTVAFGHTPQHGLGWAVGAWFVPFLNLVRPFQIVREIWHASDPDTDAEQPITDQSPPLLVAWWASWIIMNIAGQITFRVSLNAETASSLRTATMLNIGNDLLTLVAAPLAALVVRGLVQRQEARATRRMSEEERSQIESAFR